MSKTTEKVFYFFLLNHFIQHAEFAADESSEKNLFRGSELLVFNFGEGEQGRIQF